MPDAFVFALVATLVVLAAALAVDPACAGLLSRSCDAWGSGFWTLIPFTLQMSMMLISGYVLASSPPVFRISAGLPSWPRTAKGAVCSWRSCRWSRRSLNWGFSLIGTAILAREVGRRMPTRGYRALGSCSVLGICTVWARASAVHRAADGARLLDAAAPVSVSQARSR